MKQSYFIATVLVLFLLVTGYSKQTTIDVNKALNQSEERLKELDGIDTTASSFDGINDIKYRLMVTEPQTKEEAEILFQKILESIARYSNSTDVWEYYNGNFDIKSYDDGVIYEATKLIGKDLEIKQVEDYE